MPVSFVAGRLSNLFFLHNAANNLVSKNLNLKKGNTFVRSDGIKETKKLHKKRFRKDKIKERDRD